MLSRVISNGFHSNIFMVVDTLLNLSEAALPQDVADFISIRNMVSIGYDVVASIIVYGVFDPLFGIE